MMWPFDRTKTIVGSGILKGMTDWHSHILPGVDDGVKTLQESLEIRAEMERQGVSRLWLTPHVMEDIPNTTPDLKGRFEELEAAYHGTIRLHLAAEYMMDNLFEKRLENNDLLPLGEKGDRLLVETSYFIPPMGLRNILLRIKSKGYYPVLAHPERYEYMRMSDYETLKESNILFQLNLSSLFGMYGGGVRAKAERLLKKGMYSLAGSDTHSILYYQTLVASVVKTGIVGTLQEQNNQ